MNETRTYVVRRRGRSAPTQAKAGGRYLRRFPAVVDMTEDEANDLDKRGFDVVDTTPPVPDPVEDTGDGLESLTIAQLRELIDEQEMEQPAKDARKAEIIAYLRG